MVFLKWEDYLMLVITTFLTLGFGLYYALKGGSKKTISHYIQGDGMMAILPVAISLTVSHLSSITMLGVPTEVYMYGMQWCLTPVGWSISSLICSCVFIPALKRLNVTSIYEYLQRRYNAPCLRLFATVAGIFEGLGYLGIVLFTPSVSLELVTNIPIWLSIIGLMTIIVIYTCIGGFEAVVWSDAFQAALMFTGTFAVLIKGTIDAGGVTSVVTAIAEKGRANFFVFDPDPTLRQSFWSLILGSAIFELRTPFQQMTFLRIKATPTVTTAKRMYIVSTFASFLLSILVVLQGAAMFAYYNNIGCDPIVSKQVSNPNQMLVQMLPSIFKNTPCVPGLFLAGIFSASLSTVSSLLSGMSALFWEDIVKRHTKPMPEQRGVIITRTSVLIFGVIGTGIAFAVSVFQGPIYEIYETTNACLSAAVAGIFLLGWLDPWANKTIWGAITGAIVSITVLGWISIGKMTSSDIRITPPLEPASTARCEFLNNSYSWNSTYDDLKANTTLQINQSIGGQLTRPQGLDLIYSVSYKWLSTIGILTAVVTGSIISRLQASEPVDPNLVVPLGDLFCCSLRRCKRRNSRHCVKYPEINENGASEVAENLIMTEVLANKETKKSSN